MSIESQESRGKRQDCGILSYDKKIKDNDMIMRGLVSLMLIVGVVANAQKKAAYKDPQKPVEERVADLLSRMTLEEKVAQMCQYVGPEHIRESIARTKGEKIAKNDDAQGFYQNLSVNDLLKMTENGMVGSFLHVVTVEESNQLQRLALKSRLQIPLIIGIDAIHGNAMVSGTTVYPTPITMASSFDTVLVRKSSIETAFEMRATGSQWTFMPNLDVARDARWGRIGETFGEDPYLVSRMGVAMIKGFQGDNLNGKNTVLACMKHLIAGSEPSNGTNAAPMDVSERTLREVFLPPYKAAIQEAKVWTGMAAHNELNGIPCHGDKWLLDDIIRKEYNFKGFIVSDWMDIERMSDLHRYAPTFEDAFYESVVAGVDMHMHGPGYLEGVVKLVKSGRLSEKQIDLACSRILETKFRLGLFENPFGDEKEYPKILFNNTHQQTALELAEKSIVLLKNEGNLLPLDFSRFNNIFVTGPNANNQSILGDWALRQPDENVITLLEGIQQVAGAEKVSFYDYGSDVRSTDATKITEAVTMARKADVAIVVVGENPLRYMRNQKTTGENLDRMTLDLLGQQDELVEQIRKTGIPVIVVLVGGRPLTINRIAENVPAIVQAWEPGSMGGLALANILSGKVNPSGKLPVTIPRHVGQIQMIYNHKPSQYFHPYIDGPSTPLFPFGFGLSYNLFEFSDLTVDKTVASKNSTFRVSCTVTNTGKQAGTEIVQLYIRDEYSSVTRPVKELKDFARVELKPGECKSVSFCVTPDKLAFYDRNMNYVVERGDFEIMVGNSSLDKDLKKIKITIE
jgi:beta-glucosidase